MISKVIGERVVFLEDFEFNNKLYKKGHRFTIVGEDSMRGYDLKDDDGNCIWLPTSRLSRGIDSAALILFALEYLMFDCGAHLGTYR